MRYEYPQSRPSCARRRDRLSLALLAVALLVATVPPAACSTSISLPQDARARLVVAHSSILRNQSLFATLDFLAYFDVSALRVIDAKRVHIVGIPDRK